MPAIQKLISLQFTKKVVPDNLGMRLDEVKRNGVAKMAEMSEDVSTVVGDRPCHHLKGSVTVT